MALIKFMLRERDIYIYIYIYIYREREREKILLEALTQLFSSCNYININHKLSFN